MGTDLESLALGVEEVEGVYVKEVFFKQNLLKIPDRIDF